MMIYPNEDALRSVCADRADEYAALHLGGRRQRWLGKSTASPSGAERRSAGPAGSKARAA